MNPPNYTPMSTDNKIARIIDNINRINFELVNMQHVSDARVNQYLRQFAVKINNVVAAVNATDRYVVGLESQLLAYERRIEMLEASILLSRLKFN